jgi:hypothetical protein
MTKLTALIRCYRYGYIFYKKYYNLENIDLGQHILSREFIHKTAKVYCRLELSGFRSYLKH